MRSETRAGRLPTYRNDWGDREIRIGSRKFFCIGATRPNDHPHLYINMGQRKTYSCPFCATKFRFEVAPPAYAA